MSEKASGITSSIDADGICRITIDRPQVGNSLSPFARDALTESFLEAGPSPQVRAVLLQSTGSRHFCTGAGLPAATTTPEVLSPRRPGDIARMLQQGWQRLIASILECDKPVVAAVCGTAAGAGASLVLACDLVVMSSEAKLVEAFVHRGILPDSGAIHLLTRIVGLRRATELLMLGETVDAETCQRIGIVNRVVAPEALNETAQDLVRRLAGGPTVMLAQTKRLLSVASESDRNRAFEQEAWAQEIVSGTADLHEGLRAFAERRPPKFLGR